MTPMPEAAPPPLFFALMRLAALQRQSIDRLALLEAVTVATGPGKTTRTQLGNVCRHLQIKPARWRTTPDAADLPALVVSPDQQWGLLLARNAAGHWIIDWFDPTSQRWQESTSDEVSRLQFASLSLVPPYRAAHSQVLQLAVNELLAHKGLLIEAMVGGLMIAVLGVLTSFYSMQVYDRVIPSGATQTLLVLTLGMLVAVVLDYAAKRVRSRLYERLIDGVDQRLARAVYLRFLSIRLDQLPSSVGTLASQLRGYESVRGFLVGLTTHVAVDAPFACLFLAVIAVVGGPLAYIPLVFLVIALLMGAWHARQVRQLASRSQAVANRKTGLLVESVEGAEIIKSSQGGWRMLGRWLASSDEARNIDLDMRHLNEIHQYRAMALQQISYVLLIACGAWMASRGQLTMGALVACSILSGRVLSPVTQIGMQVAAWANVKAALQGLDALWALEDDHQGQAQPVLLDHVQGHYRLDNVEMHLGGKLALKVGALTLAAGQKIGILGPVGAGKTTLLRLLSGLYRPGEGRVWLDDVDIAHLSKPLLAEHIGFLPQEGRLLAGTLRDNLILGLVDPGDEAVLKAARVTGLYEAVIAAHPKGLQQDIAEGGTGMSGGQRQLINLTRVFLRKPTIWLLDEPSASLDRNLELQLIAALKQTLRPTDTLVLVTHKPEMLQLVDRLLVIAQQQVIMDGPRDAVIARLQAGPPGAPAATPLHATRGAGAA